MNKNFTFDLQRFADLSSLQQDSDGAYLITSVDDLNTLAAYVNDGIYGNDTTGLTFKQTADINLDGVDFHIGNYGKRFKGTYDGGNFTISNLTITSTDEYQGLFSYVDSAGTIKDVNLVNAKVSGYQRVGGLVGNNYGKIENCTMTGGEVSGTGDYVGGLVGYNYGTVSGITTNISVSGDDEVGGLVGHNTSNGTVSGSSVNNSVTGTGDYIGGLVGWNGGTASGITSDSTVTGKNSLVGGFVGLNSSSGTVTGSSVNNSVSSNKDVGVIYGEDDTVNISSVATISANIGGNTVTLKYGGDAQGNGYYKISSVNDLKVLSAYVKDGHDCYGLTFKQTADIVFDEVAESETNFTAIGDNNNHFKSTFDGCGYTISNLAISGGYWQGMFGYVDNGSTIKDVHLVNATIYGTKDDVGGLVGWNNGTVQNCTVTNSSIQGSWYVGVLVGDNYDNGIVIGSTSDSTVTGTGNHVGGIVGFNRGTVIGSSVNDSLKGNNYVGGLVGINYGTVTGITEDNSFSGNSYVGGPIGSNEKTDSFTPLYTLILPDGVTATYTSDDDHEVTICDKTYYKQGATFTIYVDAPTTTPSDYEKVTGGLQANGKDLTEVDGKYSVTIDDANVKVGYAGFPKIAGITFVDGDSGKEYYTITDKTDLQELATYVNNGGDTAGLTFKLTADIELTADDQIHIGKESSKFAGTFDGDGHKITVNYNSTTENCALFNYVDGTTIKNLTVDGSITTSEKYAAGIVAQNYGKTTIENCVSSVEINSTVAGDGTHGGLIARLEIGELNITNSLFNGSFLGSSTNKCGGFVGWSNGKITINNSLFAPTEITISTEGSKTFARSDSGHNPSLNGGYYTQTFGSAQGTQVYKLTLPDGVTATGVNVITFGNDTYAVGNITLTTKTGYVLNGIEETTINISGDTTILIVVTLDTTNHYVFGNETDGYTLATANNTTTYPDLTQVYAVTLNGITTNTQPATTDNGTNYYFSGTLNLTAKTGYKITNSTYTVTNEDTTINATFDTANHYVFGNETDGYTLATANNTTTYPDLIQVYALTLPEGVTANGNGVVTDTDDNYYAIAGATVTLSGVNGSLKDTDGNAISNNTYIMPAKDSTLVAATLDSLRKDGDTYLITSVDDLNTLSAYVNAGNDTTGLTFKQTQDITFDKVAEGESNFTAIGKAYKEFKGTYDGGNFTISNLTISGGENQGLFGINKGTIKDVNLVNANVKGSWYVGGLVGLNSNSGTVSGTITNSTIGGDATVGGLVGDNGGTVSGTVTESEVSGNWAVGGLVGRNGGIVSGTVTESEVSGNSQVGGLVGYNNNGTVSDTLLDGGTVSSNKAIGNGSGGYYHGSTAITGATEVFLITLPDGVTASGGDPVTFDKKNYYKKDSTITLSITEPTITENASYKLTSETYTVTKDEINPNIYISVSGGEYLNAVADISVIGGDSSETLSNTAANVTLDGGGDNDSLVGSNNAEVFVYSGGIDSINSFTATDDKIRLADGIVVSGNPQADDNGDVAINFAGGGKLIIEGAAALNTIDLYNADGTPTTYDISPAENIIFNNADPSKATSATVVSAHGDLGKQNANGTEQYAKVVTITASQEDSTIVGNAKNNKIIVEGGSDNILTGGLGKDTYNFTEGGGIITDFGIGTTKSGDGKKLATSTTNKTYDRENPETYACGTDIVRVNGKVSGIYFERDGDTSQDPTFTAVITYNDGTDEQIVVLNEIAKKPTKTGTSPIYQTNDVAAKSLKIWDTSGNKHGTLSSTKLKKLFYDNGLLTTEQQNKVAELTALVEPKTDIVTPADSQTPSVGLRSTQIAFNSNKSKN